MRPILIAAAVAVALSGPALAQHQPQGGAPTASMQGDTNAWKANPHFHKFYELARQTCADGCAKADAAAFESRSMAIFADAGAYMHMPPKAMQEHLKAIPRQVLQIGTEDPKIFASYDAFWAAMAGPD